MSERLIRIGVDVGGTKIEAAALDREGRFLARVRKPNPRDYDGALELVRDLVEEAERQAGVRCDRVGVGTPGSLSPATGLMRNANSAWLNGRAFDRDLERALDRPVRIRNDANCFALSEAIDGAGSGHHVVFGVIIGTGCGGGVVVGRQLLEGRNGVAGEWGHTPLPWARGDEIGATVCPCGRSGCLETWLSGTGLEADYSRTTGRALKGEAILAAMRAGEAAATAVFDRYVDRLGRALAVLCDVLDPDAFVFGGGMSNAPEIYERTAAVLRRHIFSDVMETPLLPAKHGDSSGVRGAAWLWPF